MLRNELCKDNVICCDDNCQRCANLIYNKYMEQKVEIEKLQFQLRFAYSTTDSQSKIIQTDKKIIVEQKEKIKDLKEQFRHLDVECERLEKENEELEAEIERLSQPILMAENVDINKEELIKRLQQSPIQILLGDDALIRARAIEEFWTKVRAYAVMMGCFHIVEYGDSVIKEMVGDNK